MVLLVDPKHRRSPLFILWSRLHDSTECRFLSSTRQQIVPNRDVNTVREASITLKLNAHKQSVLMGDRWSSKCTGAGSILQR